MRTCPQFFHCGKCNFCNWIWKGRSVHLPNGQSLTLWFAINWQTMGVVYYMKCRCKAFHVGKKKRPFWKCIKDHMYEIKNRKMMSAISWRVGVISQFSPGFYQIICFGTCGKCGVEKSPGKILTSVSCSWRASGSSSWRQQSHQALMKISASNTFFNCNIYLCPLPYMVYVGPAIVW